MQRCTIKTSSNVASAGDPPSPCSSKGQQHVAGCNLFGACATAGAAMQVSRHFMALILAYACSLSCDASLPLRRGLRRDSTRRRAPTSAGQPYTLLVQDSKCAPCRRRRYADPTDYSPSGDRQGWCPQTCPCNRCPQGGGWAEGLSMFRYRPSDRKAAVSVQDREKDKANVTLEMYDIGEVNEVEHEWTVKMSVNTYWKDEW